MNATVKTNAFKTGNSVAVRLPKGLNIKAGDALELVPEGRGVHVRVVEDVEAVRRDLRAMVAELRKLGPIGGDPNDGRIEFPDRPGLYS